MHPQQHCGGCHKRFLDRADCQTERTIFLKTSLAVLYFRTFLALSQISSTACCTSSSVTLPKSVPFKKNSQMRPSVFLTVGFCHRWCSSQKQNCTPLRAFVSSACPANCLPHSGVIVSKGAVQQKLELGLQDIGAVVVPSSRDKEPGCSVGKRKQAYRPYSDKRVVCSAAKVRAYSCLLGPIL